MLLWKRVVAELVVLQGRVRKHLGRWCSLCLTLICTEAASVGPLTGVTVCMPLLTKHKMEQKVWAARYEEVPDIISRFPSVSVKGIKRPHIVIGTVPCTAQSSCTVRCVCRVIPHSFRKHCSVTGWKRSLLTPAPQAGHWDLWNYISSELNACEDIPGKVLMTGTLTT